MTPVDIRALTLKNLISATTTDNVTKFAKFCDLVSDLINYAHQQREENKNGGLIQRKIQPHVAFHRCDSDRIYIIHHILMNAAADIFKYVVDNIINWEDVNLHHSLYLESYSYLHLCAFTMFYDAPIEEAKTTSEFNQVSNHKSIKCMKILLTTPYIFHHIDVDAKDRLGAAPLHYLAGVHNALELFTTLIEMGADLTSKDKEFRYPIHYAIKYKNVSLKTL